jgi:hypothetical protein
VTQHKALSSIPSTAPLPQEKEREKRLEKQNAAEPWCLTPVILATQEAEIRRIMVQSHDGKIVP